MYSQRGTFHPILIVHTIDSQSSREDCKNIFFFGGGEWLSFHMLLMERGM